MPQFDRNSQRENRHRGSEPNFNWRGVILIVIAFSLIAMAMLFYFATSRLYASLLLALLICTSSAIRPGFFLLGRGISYPIMSIGSPHTFGVLGLLINFNVPVLKDGIKRVVR